MADQQTVSEVAIAGEATQGSSTPSTSPSGPPASPRRTINSQEVEMDGNHGEHRDRPTTPTSTTIGTDIEQHRSPALSDQFSEAPTLLTSRSTYTANTGGRAQQSWRGGIADFYSPPTTFLSTDSLNSSQTNEDGAVSPDTEVPPIDNPVIELPTEPVSKLDEPRSFFESDSESECEMILRTASRASSFRGQRPKLIEHHTSSVGYSSTRFYQSSALAPPRNPGPSQSKAEQILGTKLSNLMDLTPARERLNPLASFNGGTAAALNAFTANELAKVSTTALAPSTPSVPSSVHSSLGNDNLDASARAEALDTLYSPVDGYGTLQLSPPNFRDFAISPLDALRSNPVSRLDMNGLQRAISAPPLPYRGNRKVTIRPADIEVIHTAKQKRLFRDSVVSTPYPIRHNSIAVADHLQRQDSAGKTVNAAKSTAEKDLGRSLSVSQAANPEVLHLELSLAKHPLATKVITIPICDRSTFDDRALFFILRATYHGTLLGFALHFLSARILSNATFILPTPTSTRAKFVGETTSFDPVDFLTHLTHPKSGHKRKPWLQWLRRQQPRHSTANHDNSTSYAHRPGLITGTSDPYFSAEGVPRTPAFVDPRTPPPPPLTGTDDS